MKEFRTITWSLLAMVVAVVALCSFLIWHGTESRSIRETNAKSVEIPDPVTGIPVLNTDFSAIRLKALFYSTREYYVAPLPAMLDPPLPKPAYRLTGTLVMPGKPVVALLLQDETRVTSKVVTGDVLDIWTVKSIEPARVVLQHGTQTEEIAKASRSGLMAVSAATPSSQASIMPNSAAGGMTKQTLSRNTNILPSGQVRLGQLGSSSTNPTMAITAQAQPRFYRPPPD